MTPYKKHVFIRRWVIRSAAFFLLAPYLLTPLYFVLNPPSTLMLLDWATLNPVQRSWVKLEKISPNMIRAVLNAEDDTFCDHFGINFTQLEKSIEKAEKRNKPVRATSTISQQTAKNLFLWHGRSWLRKALEVPLTFWLELWLPKARILEIYLNIAEFGDGVYGVDAAAHEHFGTSAKNLSPMQSALLATSLPNPIKRNAENPSSRQLLLASQLLARTQKYGADTSCLK